VKVFFDNCTSPVLATTLHGFIDHLGHSATHVKELPCGRHAPDEEWISMLASDPAVWVVITGDDRIYRNAPERRAYRAAGLRGFVMARGFQRMPLHQRASRIVWRWPEMEALLGVVGEPALFELPVGLGSKITPLPL
jgi:hypothetical protein